jgi:hypothetical protein
MATISSKFKSCSPGKCERICTAVLTASAGYNEGWDHYADPGTAAQIAQGALKGALARQETRASPAFSRSGADSLHEVADP